MGHRPGSTGIVGVQVHRGCGQQGVPQVVAHRGPPGGAFDQVRGMGVPGPVRGCLLQLLGRPMLFILAALSKEPEL